MRLQSDSNTPDLRFRVYCIIPQSFGHSARSDPYLLFVGVDAAELAPHAGFTADDVHSWNFWGEIVDFSPFYIISVRYAVAVAETFVDVCMVVIG